ncbi:hypothetical protein C8R43DRAFT_951171 [Mycena crocata]|nr:hypothetical protein C8R43DRAFT_951171 [Mycena crocata]
MLFSLTFASAVLMMFPASSRFLNPKMVRSWAGRRQILAPQIPTATTALLECSALLGMLATASLAACSPATVVTTSPAVRADMNSTTCLGTLSSQFQDAKGATTFKLCPPGCHTPPKPSVTVPPGAVSKTFCGTCCGWVAPLQNGNNDPVDCISLTPNTWPSDDGCISKATSCVHAATCVQLADRTCSAETIRE